jgi:hypothetical protein
MSLAGTLSFTVSDQPAAHGMDQAGPIVVWPRGEHDVLAPAAAQASRHQLGRS